MSFESNENSCISLGPWGGQNGVRWDDGVYNSVRQVVIYHGAAIESIQVEYDMRGSPILSEKHGGTGGIKTNKVKLDFPKEYLVSISGSYGSMVEYGPTLVRSLTFESNKRKYGPFGIQEGTHFSLPMSGGMVVGFHGRSSWYLDSIGVYLKPLLQRNPTSNLSRIPEPYTNRKQDDNKVAPYNKNGKQMVNTTAVSYEPRGGYGGAIFDDGVYTCVREVHLIRYLSPYLNPFNMNNITSPLYVQDEGSPAIVKEEPNTWMAGPWGGEGGKPWDDGAFSGIKKIYLTKGEAIYCIQVEYDRNGQSFWSVRHGGGSEGSSHTIKFDYPHEVLTGVCGYHASFNGDERKSVIKSLTFITNKGKYGPYGEETGTFFSSTKSEANIIGFHGRSGCYLNSIGVLLQERYSDPQVERFGQIGDRGGAMKMIIGKLFR